ncbi:MAG TPA: hypothetical protein VGY66_22070 [Gemmataceae bacterium]|jgi:hypothetical protein|nr:hypothetical protein [Gemmataceae bacterium]
MEAIVPAALLHELSSGDITVVSWSTASDELVLHIYKDDNEETGLLHFRGVRQVCLPPQLVIRGLRAGGADLLPEGYLRNYYSGELTIDSGERIRVEHVILFEADVGPVGFVVARSLVYEITSDPD